MIPVLAILGLSALVGLGTSLALGAAAALRPGARARRKVRKAVRRVEREREALERLDDEAQQRLDERSADYAERAEKRRLHQHPLEDLKPFGADNVRWGALREAGFQTVGDLRGVKRAQLLAVDGVGPKSAPRILRAAKKLARALADEPLPLPQVGDEDPATLAVVRAAHDLLEGREATAPVAAELDALRSAVAEQVQEVERGTSLWRRVTRRQSPEQRERALRLADEVHGTLERDGAELLGESRRVREEVERARWADLAIEELERAHEERNADYCALIEAALAGRGGPSALADTNKAYGGLPNEIARRVEALELKPKGLRLTLRRYQEFGAKFALVQERVLIGDEMGLGKTIEALAVLAHLREVEGVARFLVVAPASILHNWAREVQRHSDLGAHVLHGSRRSEALAAWRSAGGVAVTSFGTLKLLRFEESDGPGPQALIVDEAHYAKNPEAGRTRAVHRMALECRWVLFLTGTPIENRLEEFRELVRPLRPEVAKALGGDSAEAGDGEGARISVARGAFLRTVAPVYLRRNQPDVLREIPPRVDKEEWIELRRGDEQAYRAAVLERNAMAMRVAATLGDMAFDPGVESGKLARLRELLEEYAEEGAKVIVFSYFLDVLDAIARGFEGRADLHGPIRGSVAPAERMAMCDRFQGAPGHAILLAQIQAGGVGLNLQAASVIVLMEPQWKPSSEEQAIARAHRMGQTRTVIVHRMLARNSIDERMVEALAEKRELFDDFARKSLVKEASAQATESELVRQVVEAEVERVEALTTEPEERSNDA